MFRSITASALALLATTAVALPTGASAEIVPVDDAPAATLLLPYFEVDLGVDPAGAVLQPAQDDHPDKGKEKGKDKGKNKGKGKDKNDRP